MALPRDPYAKKFFRVELGGILVGGFESAQGLSWESEVLEFQEGGRNDALVRLPGQSRLGQITLARGFTNSREMVNWARTAAEGGAMRRELDLVVLGDDLSERARYTLLRAWPTRAEVKELSSGQGHLVETLEIAHEGIVKSSKAAPAGPGALAGMMGPVQNQLAAAEQRARDAARVARQGREAAQAMADAAAGQVPGVSLNLSLDAALGGLANPAGLIPSPPAAPSGASPLDALFSLNASVPPRPSAGAPPGGTRDAISQGAPPANVTPHPNAPAFTASMSASGAPPSPPPGPSMGVTAPGAGFASTGATGAAATANGDWSDGASRRQPPGQVREPPIQSGASLRF